MPVRAKCCLSLHLTARTHLDSRIHLGERDRRCDLPHCFSACTRKARAGPIQTIAPAFDGLKVFPSLAGLSIARFGRSLVQACQPAGVSAHRVSALTPQSGGLRSIIDAEMSKYLSKKDRLNLESTDYFSDLFDSSARQELSIPPRMRCRIISRPAGRQTYSCARLLQSRETRPP